MTTEEKGHIRFHREFDYKFNVGDIVKIDTTVLYFYGEFRYCLVDEFELYKKFIGKTGIVIECSSDLLTTRGALYDVKIKWPGMNNEFIDENSFSIFGLTISTQVLKPCGRTVLIEKLII